MPVIISMRIIALVAIACRSLVTAGMVTVCAHLPYAAGMTFAATRVPIPLAVLRMGRILPVLLLMAITDGVLIMPAPELCILLAVPVVIHPWLRLVNHHFVRIIQIETAVLRREG